MARSAADVLRRLGGVADASAVLRLTSRHALRAAEAAGEIRRVARGVYALPDLLLSDTAAAGMRGVISHQSAAAHWKLEQLYDPVSAHVTVPAHARRLARKGVTLHYADLTDEFVTSPLRTVLDCATTMPFREALAIADSACRRDAVDADQLLVAAERMRGPGRQRALRVARHADGRAENPFESAMRAIVIEAGVTGFETQLVVPGLTPTVRVDLGDPVRRMALEADSFAFHIEPAALEKDCRRYDELVRLGWLVLRFTYDHVTLDPGWLAKMVIDTCALRDTRAPRTGRSRRT